MSTQAEAPRSRDVELAEELLRGNAEAFDEFVRLFQSKLYQYSLMMCGHREDAEEVAQDTLLKVFENFDQLQDARNVRAWVFRIARNACLMKRRKSVYAPKTELSLEDYLPRTEDDGNGLRMQIADWSKVPESQFLQKQLKGILAAAIQELPEIYRAVLLLRDVEELNTEETAEILDVKVDVVKTRLHRARLAIRQKLDRHLLEASTTLSR
ncbi:MAG: sigma-70 family RNA polymerase sigma factor [Bryobacterales bacterium]|nr:sigma-70 family RNA polymerase sigma factor [Bryobacterales bacterium]